MKFEHKYPDAGPTQRFEFEYSFVTKMPKLGQCRFCGSFTRWIDVLFQVPVCSEECNGAMWRQYRADEKKKSTYENFELHFQHVKAELLMAEQSQEASKDILIVVHDQLDYLKACIESIKATTKNYHLYVWDNGSKPDTAAYIEGLMLDCGPGRECTTMRSEENTGFIFPNNEMAGWGEGEFIILLNSDTKVFDYWDKAMTGFLDLHPDVLQVGYWGGHLGPDGRGFGGANGFDIDYVPGWCFCMRRSTFEEFGLFDAVHLRWAYCEDADLSLRLKEAGGRIFALHAPLVHHYQNKTIVEVEKEGLVDVRATFDHNHCYIKERWADYLAKRRVLLRRNSNDAITNFELAGDAAAPTRSLV